MSLASTTLLAVVAGLSALAMPRPANAAAFSSGSYSQCVPFSLGVGRVFVDGGEYEYAYNGSLPLGEVGYGFCGPYTEFSLRARFAVMSRFFLAAPALLARVHTRTPDGAGLEAGLGLRAGVQFLHASNEPYLTPEQFDGSGVFLTFGPDARLWLGEQWGLTAGADLTLGSVSEHFVGVIAVTTGGIIRW